MIDRVLIVGSCGILALVTVLNILGAFYTVEFIHFLHEQGIPGFLVP
jgi:hypothetical protein